MLKAFHTESIRLNNLAVTSILKGQYSNAIAHLANAHLAARENIRCLPQDCTTSQESSASFGERIGLFDQLFLEAEGHQKFMSVPNKNVDDEYFIYSRPIHVPCGLPQEHHESQAIVSTSILFNMALVHHFKAIEIGGPTSSLGDEITKRALRLYRLAFQLHHAQQHGESDSGHLARPSNLLLLALMNNTGHVYHMLDETKHASTCFEHLFASIMWLRATSWWQSRDGYQQDDATAKAFEGYSQSAATWLIGQSLDYATAPAA